MEPLQYDSLEILLRRRDDSFEVQVVDSPAGQTVGVPFTPPVTADALKLLVLTLRAVHGVRSLEAEAVPDAKKFGTALFDALFHDDLLICMRTSLQIATARQRGLRIQVRFSDAAELVNLPWELLYDHSRRRFLCLADRTPLVRYVDLPEPVQPLAVTGPLRMLVAISSPSDYPPLDVEQEWQQLRQVLDPLVTAGRLQVDRLPTASLESLRHALMKGDYHIFHFMGHGGLDAATGDGVLVFTGPDGRSARETGQDLGVMLEGSPVRMAVLNSCEGARISAVDPYAGTAVSLVQQGIPAVVAMQFEITDTAAIAFSRTMYEAIAYGWPLDMAVSEARRAILAVSRSEWATPVLYLRSPDGAIFTVAPEVEGAPEPDAPAKVPPVVAAASPPPAPPPPAPPRTLVQPTAASLFSPAPPSPPQPPPSQPPPSQPPPPLPTPTGRGQEGHERRRLRGVLLVLALLLTLGLGGWSAAHVFGASGRTPQPPSGLAWSLSGSTVTLTWDAARGPAPAHWEVTRDGAVIGRPVLPLTVDFPPRAGSHVYSVVAVDDAGRRSAAATVLVPALSPTASPSTTVGPSTSPSSTTHPPTRNADLKAFVRGQSAGAGSGEVVVGFAVDNLGADPVSKENVVVTLDSGMLLDAVWAREGATPQPCERTGLTARCRVGAQAIKGLVLVDVTVLVTSDPVKVSVRATSDVPDANSKNSRATATVSPSPTASPTTDSPTPTP